MALARKNHYVPRVYLKHFESAGGEIFLYRTLVSRPRVKAWKPTKTSAVAYHLDLYTRWVFGEETDEFEKWLDQNFESPVEPILDKVHANEELEGSDWDVLIRFLACQIARTPASLIENLPVWSKIMPAVLAATNEEVHEALLMAKITGQPPSIGGDADTGSIELPVKFPIRVDREDIPEEGISRISTNVMFGRPLWQWNIQQLVTSTVKVLHDHYWSIFHAANGVDFFTSDDPVIRLNYTSYSQYNFKGGWGSKGTEILLPLSPRHLMYTKIGERFAPRGMLLTEGETHRFRKMVAEHAYRQIFAATEDAEVPNLRPRRVNATLVEFERDQWRHWHEEQSRAEAEFMGNAETQ
jgi:hypothetical protein